jgi:hypothetical protein
MRGIVEHHFTWPAMSQQYRDCGIIDRFLMDKVQGSILYLNSEVMISELFE